MSIIERAFQILQVLVQRDAVAGRPIVARDLMTACNLPETDFDPADTYLLQSRYVTGTQGGLDGLRWLTPAGIDHYETLKQRSEPRSGTASISQPPAVRSHTVLLIHGIRTQAEWAQRAAAILESDPSIRVVPTRYEFFDVIRFLLPFSALRRRPIQRILKLLRDEISKQPAKVSVIAHSFGTYIVSRILEEDNEIELHHLILCGSIIPDDFDWARFKHRLGNTSGVPCAVLNDCGISDPWPVLAKSITWGYGSSGRFGFGHGRVKDRFHAVGHSGFFTEAFITTYWLPYLAKETIIPGELNRPKTPFLLSLLTVVKLRYLVIASALLGSLTIAPVQIPHLLEALRYQLSAQESAPDDMRRIIKDWLGSNLANNIPLLREWVRKRYQDPPPLDVWVFGQETSAEDMQAAINDLHIPDKTYGKNLKH